MKKTFESVGTSYRALEKGLILRLQHCMNAAAIEKEEQHSHHHRGSDVVLPCLTSFQNEPSSTPQKCPTHDDYCYYTYQRVTIVHISERIMQLTVSGFFICHLYKSASKSTKIIIPFFPAFHSNFVWTRLIF